MKKRAHSDCLTMSDEAQSDSQASGDLISQFQPKDTKMKISNG